ncbi:MAG: GNAT family N-acetyltransferase [Chloroflexus aggregans]|jgi:GNAT superfamily N-acetyltransferase|uniref:GNAT family N-acetyltransferase n=1 Tax=Chloroflexus aggregans TaxID=152260 RepID=A0A2J6X7E7_9CHLR|nr:GNAT family N-acetyltransferase [Chloroflexus sp.]PMP82930.1 MAG: GNAT family N-acetyltransferase [Chloroflexus aggregans]GIV89040.1 MAG: N-acetyltransferase GCN5 [Chloroflexus sp.]
MSIVIVQTRPEHIPQLVIHQKICFPHLAPEDHFDADNFAAHLRVFPEGQHVALDGDRVVGQSSTFRIRGEKVFVHHTFHEIVDYGNFGNHDPEGEWLYGADMSVHPDYRGRGISRMLYNARKELVRRLGMRGIVAGGMTPGYVAYRDRMTFEEYVDAVVAGRLTDPTLTPQLRNGFTVRGIIYNHIHDSENPHATLIVWEA